MVDEKIKALQSIDLNRMLDDSIREIEDFILEINQEQLYEKGQIDVNNPGKREQYAESTKYQKLKRAEFKKTDFVTLRWNGEFYDSFKLLIFEDSIIISATDLKWANWLEGNKRFGNALGLTEEGKDKLRAELLPIFIRRLKDEL